MVMLQAGFVTRLGAVCVFWSLRRVTLDTSGDSDRVRISNVQLLDEPDDEAPRMPSPQPAPPDVLLAGKHGKACAESPAGVAEQPSKVMRSTSLMSYLLS